MRIGQWVAALGAGMLVAAGVVGGCSRGAEDGGNAQTIKIGSLNSMTGNISAYGTSSDKGIRLAAEERNAKGGLLGKQIAIVTRDTESRADQTPAAVLKLIQDDKVVAILGEFASKNTKAAAPKAQQNKVPLVSPGSTAPDVTSLGNYIFRTCFVDDVQGTWMARHAFSGLGKKNAVILTDSANTYSVELSKVIEKEFANLGGKIIGQERYAEGDFDFKPQLTQIKGSNPEVIFLPGYYNDVARIVKQARDLGINAVFIGGDGWGDHKTIEVGGKAVEGSFFTDHFSPTDPDENVQAFAKAFKARYGEDPNSMAALGYEGAKLLFDAIERAGSTEGPKIRDALAATKDFPGLMGKITIDEKRNAVKPGVLVEIKDSKFQTVKRMEP